MHPLTPTVEKDRATTRAQGTVVSQWAQFVRVRLDAVEGASRPDGTPLSDVRDPLLAHLWNPTRPELLCTSRRVCALAAALGTRP